MHIKYIFSLLLFITIPNYLISQDIKIVNSESSIKYANSITKDELKEMLYIFSSDEFGGRGTPSKGQDLATDFLKKKYIDLAIQPALDKSYEHKVFLQFDEKPISYLKINEKIFSYYKDYIAYNNGPDVEFRGSELVYVGYGIEDKNYDSYNGLDVKGKVVLAIGGEPVDENGNYVISGGDKRSEWSSRNEITKKKQAASKKGAKVLILINDYLFNRYSNL